MENLTPEEPLPGGAVNPPADGNGTESNVVELKDILNQALGKEGEKAFKDNETALKSIKDTYTSHSKLGWYKKAVDAVAQAKGFDEKQAVNYIMETLTQEKPPVVEAPKSQEPAVDPNKFVSREEYDREMFFSKNADYEPYKEVMTNLQKATGKSLNEVAAMEPVKALFEKAKAHDATEKTKSVLMSNPRLGAVQDKITQAKTKLTAGDHSGAKADAVAAVIDAYGIGQ